MIEVTRENMKKQLTEEDSFSLKIVSDRYLLKQNEKAPERDDVCIVEFQMEGVNNAGYNTIKEVALVDDYNKETEVATVTVFTGVDRGKVFEVKRQDIDLLLERDIPALQKRVAKALSGGDEKLESELAQRTMRQILFGGRILAGAGTGEELTYFNCYVAPMIHDSRGGIADHRKIVMEIMSRGGGVGTNGSTLRPTNTKVTKVRGKSSGAVSWLDDLSQLTHKVSQGGSRRGAQMIALADFHPDLIQFITAKVQKPLRATITIDGKEKELKFGKRGNETLSGANISVLLSDKFMEAYYRNDDWELVFPDVGNYTQEEMELYDKVWHEIGDPYKLKELHGLRYKVYARIPARDIANLLGVCAHGSAEPGILFLERANKFSNTWYFNPLICTNPCGEQFLAKWSVCNLGHVNFAEHLKYNAEKGFYEVDIEELKATTRALTRALDNVIDATPYYFDENEVNQKGERRLGLGTMGVDEALKLCGYDYGTQEGRDFAEVLFRTITVTAYEESVELAKERGPFTYFEAEPFLQSEFMKFMAKEEPELIESIREHGIRNATIITQAPTGTTGTLAQTSTGIEPFFAGEFWRSSRIGHTVQKAPVIKKAESVGIDPAGFKYAGDYSTKQHLDFQAICQKWCDSSISKTINAPKDTAVEDVIGLMEYAYEIGLKGFTVYVDGSREFQVLGTDESGSEDHSELPMDHYDVKTVLTAGKVGVGYEDGKLKKLTIDIEKLSEVLDEEGLVNHLAHLIKSGLEAHNSTDCNNCGAPLKFEEGCFKCEACGFSKCG
ncbi:ribonucleoside-diphosphate reductase [Bacillus phage vB_BpsS-36]|uniref:ribonucleoside-diphosphate reductase n=1 Tax=Bacillus phage vB_BpsS-36 TaxID=2419622 RepID=A0A3G3BXS9_9CAUD|nr:ribonucleoside-diphosphate reductase [Bacillus phage vB_BpsS-36]